MARNGAVSSKARAINQLKSLIVTAPEALRAQLTGLPNATLITTCARLRPTRDDGHLVDPTAATKAALASVARRIKDLASEINALDHD